LPIEGINSTMLLNKVSKGDKKLFSKDDLLNYIKQNEFEILVTLGAGDIDTLVLPIENLIKEKIK
jgi:UDP-N-acetylmuramate--alanine ligase